MERFWNKVAKAGENDCWLWTGAKTKRGYGLFHISKKPPKVSQAHRVAYALAVAEPGELHVLHSCDNPSCCNPAHLRLGTNQDNVDDRVNRKRSSGGGQFHKQKNWKRQADGRFTKQ